MIVFGGSDIGIVCMDIFDCVEIMFWGFWLVWFFLGDWVGEVIICKLWFIIWLFVDVVIVASCMGVLVRWLEGRKWVLDNVWLRWLNLIVEWVDGRFWICIIVVLLGFDVIVVSFFRVERYFCIGCKWWVSLFIVCVRRFVGGSLFCFVFCCI